MKGVPVDMKIEQSLSVSRSRHLRVRAAPGGLRVGAVWQLLRSYTTNVDEVTISFHRRKDYEEVTFFLRRFQFDVEHAGEPVALRFMTSAQLVESEHPVEPTVGRFLNGVGEPGHAFPSPCLLVERLPRRKAARGQACPG